MFFIVVAAVLKYYAKGISFDTSTKFAPYRILYIVLGFLAVLVGVAVMIWLPDSPVTARVLTKEERIAAIERIRDDQIGTENHTFKKAQVYEALSDIRTWLMVLIMFLCKSFIPLRTFHAEMFFS